MAFQEKVFLFEISAKISYEKKDKKETGLIIVIMTNPFLYLEHFATMAQVLFSLKSYIASVSYDNVL